MTQTLQDIPEHPLVTQCDTPKKFFGVYPFKVTVRSRRTRKSCSLRAGLDHLKLRGNARSHGTDIVFFENSEDVTAMIEYLSRRVVPRVRWPSPIEVYGPRNTAVAERLAEIDPVRVRVVKKLPYHARYRVDAKLWSLVNRNFFFDAPENQSAQAAINQITEALVEFKPRAETRSFFNPKGKSHRIPHRWYVPDHPNLRTAIMMLSLLDYVDVTKYETYNEIAESKIDK